MTTQTSKVQKRKKPTKATPVAKNKRSKGEPAPHHPDGAFKKQKKFPTSSRIKAFISDKKKVIIITATAILITIIALVPIIARLLRPNPTPPSLEITGVEGKSETPQDGKSTGEGAIVQILGEIATECKMMSELDDDLNPSITKESNEIRDFFTYGKNKKDYTFYGAAWCDVKLTGSYHADDYNDVALSLDSVSRLGYELETKDDASFTITYRYEIYANREGQPDGKAHQVKLSLSGKNKYDPSDVDHEILRYDLTITTTLREEDGQFLDDWKEKIDQRIAEEERIAQEKKAEEERLAREKEEREKEEAIATALTPSYTDLFRNHASYRGKYIKITGQVLQTDSSNSFCRVGTKGSRRYGYYDDVVYVSPCSTTTKILEDDIVSIIGIGQGTKTYTTVMGASTELPYISGKYFGIVNE